MAKQAPSNPSLPIQLPTLTLQFSEPKPIQCDSFDELKRQIQQFGPGVGGTVEEEIEETPTGK